MGSYSPSAQHLVDSMVAAAAANPARAVAFQGAPGANSDIAVRQFDADALPLPCYSFEDAIDAVQSGAALRAMIPIENSLHGRVADIHFLLPESGLHIVGEHFLPIRYGLMSRDLARFAGDRVPEDRWSDPVGTKDLGRGLERIDMTSRLLDVRHDLVWPDTGPVATLRSAAGLCRRWCTWSSGWFVIAPTLVKVATPPINPCKAEWPWP